MERFKISDVNAFTTLSALKNYEILGMTPSDVYVLNAFVFKLDAAWNPAGSMANNTRNGLFKTPSMMGVGAIMRVNEVYGPNIGSGNVAGFKVKLVENNGTIVCNPSGAGVIDLNKVYQDGWLVMTFQYKIGSTVTTANQAVIAACICQDYVGGSDIGTVNNTCNHKITEYYDSTHTTFYGNEWHTFGASGGVPNVGWPDFAGSSLYARSTEFTEAEMKELNQTLMSHYGITKPAGHYLA